MVKLKNSRGFSLVELSVALVILGFVIYAAMAIFTERSAIDRVAVTERRLDEIERAIRIYYLENDYLPCPADGELALDEADFATADCAIDNFTITGIAGGGVPTRTLNLPDIFAFDGWGKRITYYASDNATNGSWGAGNIVVNDSSGYETTLEAVYILISHGENGIGAWNRNGSAIRVERIASTSPHEVENAHVALDGDYESADAFFTDSYIDDTENVAAADYFDDIVRWKTKEMIDYDADRLP